MVDLLPKCVECGCNVADLVEPEVERAAHLKLGHYVNSVWICDSVPESPDILELAYGRMGATYEM